MSAAGFWDRLAKKYAATPVPDEDIYQAKLAKTRALLTPNSKVLEFGCGTGTTAVEHAPFCEHIDALDFSANMIAICQEKKQMSNAHNLTFHQATLGTFAPRAQHYHMVLGLSILHLMKDKDDAIDHCFQCLLPGGHFISSTACIGDNLKLMKYIAPVGKALGLLPEINVFTQAQLEHSLTRAGFELVDIWKPSDAVFIIARRPN